MKRRMKGLLLIGLLVGILFALAVSASAAEPADKAGVYDLTVTDSAKYTLEVQTAAGTKITAAKKSIEADGVSMDVNLYENAEKFVLTYPESTDDFQLILALSGDETTPTMDNIVYIDQSQAESGTVAFTIFPSEMSNGTYHIYRSWLGGDGLEEIASFSYYVPYKLGDVNDDGNITPTDALMVLQDYVGSAALKGIQKLAADVNKDSNITPTDALMMLQDYVGSASIGS